MHTIFTCQYHTRCFVALALESPNNCTARNIPELGFQRNKQMLLHVSHSKPFDVNTNPPTTGNSCL